MSNQEKEMKEKLEQTKERDSLEQQPRVAPMIEEITIEELAVDGICGIY